MAIASAARGTAFVPWGQNSTHIKDVIMKIYARLCGFSAPPKSQGHDIQHHICWPKLSRIIERYRPWISDQVFEEIVHDLGRTCFGERQAPRPLTPVCPAPAPSLKPVVPLRRGSIPKITVRPHEERAGTRFSVSCKRCGHLRDTFTRTRANVERDAHAVDHAREPLFGYFYAGPSRDTRYSPIPVPIKPITSLPRHGELPVSRITQIAPRRVGWVHPYSQNMNPLIPKMPGATGVPENTSPVPLGWDELEARPDTRCSPREQTPEDSLRAPHAGQAMHPRTRVLRPVVEVSLFPQPTP